MYALTWGAAGDRCMNCPSELGAPKHHPTQHLRDNAGGQVVLAPDAVWPDDVTTIGQLFDTHPNLVQWGLITDGNTWRFLVTNTLPV